MPFGEFILILSKDPSLFFPFYRFSDTFVVLSTSITGSKSTQIRPAVMTTPLVSEVTPTFTSKTTAASKILVTRTFSISTHVSTSVSLTLRTSAEEPVIIIVGFFFIPLECHNCNSWLEIVMYIQIENGVLVCLFLFFFFNSPQPCFFKYIYLA